MYILTTIYMSLNICNTTIGYVSTYLLPMTSQGNGDSSSADIRTPWKQRRLEGAALGQPQDRHCIFRGKKS